MLMTVETTQTEVFPLINIFFRIPFLALLLFVAVMVIITLPKLLTKQKVIPGIYVPLKMMGKYWSFFKFVVYLLFAFAIFCIDFGDQSWSIAFHVKQLSIATIFTGCLALYEAISIPLGAIKSWAEEKDKEFFDQKKYKQF